MSLNVIPSSSSPPLRGMLQQFSTAIGTPEHLTAHCVTRNIAFLRGMSAARALIPRRKAILRVTQCAVRYSGVPMAVLNCCSIRAVVAMNCSGSIFSRSRIRGVSPGMYPRLSSRITRPVASKGISGAREPYASGNALNLPHGQ